jgi:O-Antigen ligase
MFYAAAFALFCVVCTWFAFRRHPIWGVYFYLATTYVYPPGRWWGAMFGDLRWALIAAVITALAVVFHRGKLQDKPMWLSWGPAAFLGLYAMWMWVQVAWALDTADHVRGSTEFVKCLLAMWFVYRAVDSKDRVRDLMLGHVLGCALLGLYAYSVGRQGDRLDGVGGPNLDDANTLGMYLITAAICATGLVMTQKGWRRYAALICLPLIVNGFVLANSRGAFLGLIGGALVLAFCTAKQHRWVLWSFAGVGVIGLTVLIDQAFIDRMFTIQDVTSQDEDADTSARSRLVIAKAQLEMFTENPLGIGWRGTAVLSPRYMDERWLTGDNNNNQSRSSHNTYLTALTEQGIPGALLYGGLLLWVAGAALRVRRMNRAGGDPELATLGAALVGAIVVVLVAGLTADYLTKEVQFWLYAGLVSVLWLGEPKRLPGPLGPRATVRAAPAQHPST